ncbi:MAG: GNAT family N-acetyltransferase [Acutalibacter sp.]|jgi:ribosomal protein S18 acetylase RimI-like enzyme
MILTIRPAQPQDAPVFTKLNREFNGEGEEVASAQEAARALAQGGPEQVLLAFVSGEPVGFLCGLVYRSACYWRSSAQVTELYVRPSHRRQGVARGLMERFLAACRQAGVGEVTLVTGADNQASRAFYQSMGFAPTGEAHCRLDLASFGNL